MPVALDRQAQFASRRLKLGQDEVAPLGLEADDVAEEEEISPFYSALGRVPRPTGVGREKLD